MEHQVYAIKRDGAIVYIGKHSCRGTFCSYNPRGNKVCNYKGSGKKLYAVYKKYSRSLFDKEILKVCPTEEDALLYETEVIHRLQAKGVKLYNLQTEGTSWGLGRTVSQATRQRMSISASKRVASAETRAKISEALSKRVPYVRTTEIREKTSRSLKGKKNSKEKCLNQRKALGRGYIVKGKEYYSYAHIAEDYPNLSASTAYRRVNSDKYPDWRKK